MSEATRLGRSTAGPRSATNASARLVTAAIRLVLFILASVPSTVLALTNVSGTISQSTTWTLAGSPYVVTGWVTVAGVNAPVLTIEPGVEVRFNGGIGMSIGYQQPGELVAVGTAEKPIKFTSNAATVAPRQWRGLYFYPLSTAGTRIENGVIEGAGEGADGGVMVAGGAPTFRGVTVRSNGASAIRVYGGSPTIAGCLLQGSRDWDAVGLDARGGTIALTDTTITGNAGAAIALYLGTVLEGLTGLTVGGNGSNVVWYRTREISSNERWKSFGLPYVLTDGWFYVRGASSPVLTIEPGVEVRFNGGLGMSIGYQQPGGLVAAGTPERPIKFTSNAATVVPRQWRGLYFEAQTSEGTRIENGVIEGAGEGADGGVMVAGGAPTFRGVTVRSNGASAIRVYGGSPTIAGCLLQGSRDWDAVGLDARGGTIALTDTTITGNAGAAIALWAGAALEGLAGLTVADNAGGNVVRYRSTEIPTSQTWKSFGLPYVLMDGWVYVRGAASPVLTIEPGVEVRFAHNHGISIGDNSSPGGLVAVGTVGEPIRFTSNASSVAAGYWRRISLNEATAAGTRIENAIVEGAGYESDGGLVIRGGGPVIRAVTFLKNRGSGVRVNGGSPTIDGVTSRESENAAMSVYGGTPTITSCTLSETTGDGFGLDVRGGTATLRDTTITANAGAAMTLYAGAVLEGLTGLTVADNAGGNVVRYRSTEIPTSQTWKSFGLPYVLMDGWVYVRGATSPVLTIEPGVEVRFAHNHGISIGDNSSPGGLVAVGTAGEPIRFTSNASPVAAGYWRRISLNVATAAGTRIENAIVEGAGYESDGGLVIRGGAPVLRSVTFLKNRGSGLRVEGGSPTIEAVTSRESENAAMSVYGGTPTITSCTLSETTGDGFGLDVRGGTVTLRDTTITGNAGAAMTLYAGAVLEGLTGLTVADNAGGNVVRYRSTEIPTSQTWKSFGLPYVLMDGWVYVRGAASPVLTIEPGVEVRFAHNHGISIGDNSSPGGLVAVGTAGEPIRFTSNASPVAAGYWRRISLNVATAAGTRIENAIVEGAGYESDGGLVIRGGAPVLRSVTFLKNRGSGLRVEGGSPTIFGCEIREGTERGLWLLGGSMPRVIGNTITGNAGAGIQNESSRATIRFNTVSGNGGYGILSSNGALGVRDNSVSSNGAPARNDDTASRTFDVRQQWWGAETPPAGLVGRVQYDPWLGSPPTPPFAVSSFERSTAAFNPEGAGVTFAFELPSPGSWTLTLADAGGSVVRSLSGNGLSASVLWDGRDEGGVSLPDGVFSYRFTAMEPASSITAAPLLGRVTLDRTLPLALLAAPLPGAAVVSPVGISGTAAGSGFAAYTLEYGVGEHPATMTLIDRGSLPVTEGSLGLWSALLTEPHYTLRLTVTASGGKVATQSLTVRLDGQTACQ